MQPQKETSLQVSVYSSPEELESHASDLDILALNALETNVSNEWWALAPAMRHLKGAAEVSAAVVWGEVNGSRAAIGLFPFKRERRYSGLPVPHFGLWRHFHAMLCSPLVWAGLEDQCLSALFEWAETLSPAVYLLNFGHICGEGAFLEALRRFSRRTRRHCEEIASHERAFLTHSGSSEEYLRKLPKKRRKEIGRLGRRLAEDGEVTTEILPPGAPLSDIERALGEFLELEARGWKGRKGTAINSHEHERLFFQELTGAAARRGSLSIVILRVNGAAVAVQCNLHAGRTAFSYKITFDERYSRHSPGILVAWENLRYVLDMSQLEWMDSGADPHHPMIDRLWIERRKISSVNVELKRRFGPSAYRLVFLGKVVYKTFQRYVSHPTSSEEPSDEHAEI